LVAVKRYELPGTLVVNVAVVFVVHGVFNCVVWSRWNVVAEPPLTVKLSNT
jgi:hypothetical protein